MLLRGRDTTLSGWEFPHNGSHSTSDEALQQCANVLPNVIHVVAPVTYVVRDVLLSTGITVAGTHPSNTKRVGFENPRMIRPISA